MELNQKILSDLTVFMKYAKYLPEKNRRETWEELVDRNKEMHIKKFPELKDEIEHAYKFVYEKKVLPSMRSLQFAGKPIEINPSRIFNCFNRNTSFITSHGIKSFNDYNDGDEITVLTHLGNWKPAKVRYYGKGMVNKITINRGTTSNVVYATSNHRWIKFDGSITTELKEGDYLKAIPNIFDEFDYDNSDPVERLYWCYGYVFGDGTRCKNSNGEYKYSMVRLCGNDKNKYLYRFDEMGFKTSASTSLNNDIMVYTGAYLKTVPDVTVDSPNLIRAFTAGYLDADGNRNTDTTMLSKFKGITATHLDHTEFIEKIFPVSGVVVVSKNDIGGQQTNFGKRHETAKSYRLNTNLNNSTNSRFRINEIVNDVFESDLWCLEVEDDHSFVLDFGVCTGNCCFLPVDDWRAFPEIIFLLLGGTGVGYSVQKHDVEKLPDILKPRTDRRRRWLVNDSIEGWADAVKILMKSYFEGGSKIQFDFSDIRPKGARLATSGGKAPGPQPLKECLVKIEGILEGVENGDKLKPIQVHDIICHLADAVLAGGIRRAALISLFSADDDEMISCKSGNWWELNPQRGRANNSAVLLRHKITKEYFMDLWKRIELSNAGEPGIYLSNDKSWGTNPSLRAGTRVWTSNGIFPIEFLQDSEFTVTNLNGVLSPAKCWLSGKNQKLWEITLEGGHKYYATKEHEWAVQQLDGTYIKVKTPDLKSGNKFPNVLKSELGFGHDGTYDDGFLCGWHLGDGWTTKRKEGHLQHGLICTKKDGIKDKLVDCLRSIGVGANLVDRGTWYELNTSNKDWNAFQKKFEYTTKNNGLPKATWNRASESFRKGLIDALFSADGTIEVGTKKRVTLTTAHELLAKDVCELLGFYGIKTSVNRSKTVLNGKSFDRFDVRISGKSNIEHFRNLFKLSVEYKQLALDGCVWKNKTTYDNTTVSVVSVVETLLEEDVWDISVMDDTHCFQIAHSITGNCCEIALRPFQFCNLCEVNASNLIDQNDLNERVTAAALIGTLQASYTDFHYLRPIWQRTTEKDALIGISMTGIASNAVTKLDLEKASCCVSLENERVSSLIGINKAARMTCIKPAGTTSLTLGTSSGIHAWHNDFYIRRIRVGKNESIYSYLYINHPELIEDDYFRPHDTAVISIPQKAPEGSTVRLESALDLLERIKYFYQNWIKPGHRSGQNTHNVSATISIDKNKKYIHDHITNEYISVDSIAGGLSENTHLLDEWEVVGEWMWQNRDYYNGLSVLPYDNGSYIQAPFEDISDMKFYELVSTLHDIDLTKVVEIDDNTDLAGELACAGNQCEIK